MKLSKKVKILIRILFVSSPILFVVLVASLMIPILNGYNQKFNESYTTLLNGTAEFEIATNSSSEEKTLVGAFVVRHPFYGTGERKVQITIEGPSGNRQTYLILLSYNNITGGLRIHAPGNSASLKKNVASIRLDKGIYKIILKEIDEPPGTITKQREDGTWILDVTRAKFYFE